MLYLKYMEYTKERFEEMTEGNNGSLKYIDWEKDNHELLELQYREYLFTGIIHITMALQKTV